MKNLFIAIILLFSTNGIAQPSFKMRIDSINIPFRNSTITSCADGGIAIASLRQLNGFYNSFIYKMDANGNYLWSKYYYQDIPDFDWYNGIQIKATSDSGFYLLTQPELDMFGWFSSPLLQKINKDGIVTSNVATSVTGSWGNILYMMQVEKYNNNLHGSGTASSYDPVEDEPCCYVGYAFKFDSTLNILKRLSYNTLLYDSLDVPFHTLNTYDTSFNWNGFNLYDTSGYHFSTIQYTTDSNQAINNGLRSYCQDNNNFYFLESVLINSVYRPCIHKVDKNFNTIFSIVLDSSQNIPPLIFWERIEMNKNTNGNLLIATTFKLSNVKRLPFMMEIDSSGNILHAFVGDATDTLYSYCAIDTISNSFLFLNLDSYSSLSSFEFQREFISSPSCGFIPVTINTFPISIIKSSIVTSDTLTDGVYPIVMQGPIVPEVNLIASPPIPLCGVLSGSHDPYPTESCKLSIFPNPANDKLNISFNCDKNQIAEVKIFNIIGEEVFSKSISTNNYETMFDVSELPAGIYLVKSQSADQAVFNSKIVIQK